MGPTKEEKGRVSRSPLKRDVFISGGNMVNCNTSMVSTPNLTLLPKRTPENREEVQQVK